MSSAFRGRGRGGGGRGVGSTTNQNGDLSVVGAGAPLNLNGGHNDFNNVIIDISDSQPPPQPSADLTTPTKGILRNKVVEVENVVTPADAQQTFANGTNEKQLKPPIVVDQPVPFGGVQVSPVSSVTGRGSRGVRGGLGRGGLGMQVTNGRPFTGNVETSPPKSVSFDSSTVFNGKARGGLRGASRGGIGRGANAIELGSSNDDTSIGTMLRRGGRGRGASSHEGSQRDERPNDRNNQRGRGNEGGGRAGRGRGGGRSEFGPRDEGRGRGRSEFGSRDEGRGRGRSEFGPRDEGHGHRRPSPTNGENGLPQNEPRPRPHTYKKRDIESLYKEDFNVSERYVDIRDEDEDLQVSGQGENYQSFDQWKDFGLEPQLLENIERCKYVVPRKIQSYTFPLIRDGCDVKAHAETSSGKSAAFLLPIIDNIMKLKKAGKFQSRRGCPFAVILSPTRELVIQIYEQGRKLCNGCDVSISLSYGGTFRHESIRNISIDGCDLLVGTPGRICDFFQCNYLLCDLIKVVVLDEADFLLDDQFMLNLRILEKMPNWPPIGKRQALLFSATFPEEVGKWADEFMRPNSPFVTKGVITPNRRIRQTFIMAEGNVKRDTLVRLLQLELEQNKQSNPADPKLLSTMVFVNTRRDAELVANFLSSRGFPATTISGNRDQALREKAVWDFRTGEYQIIVTTDVCARGHDIKNLERVINLDLPIADRAVDAYHKYVQRVGRTGRIQQGMATSFFDTATDMDLAGLLVNALNILSQSVPSWLQSAAKDGVVPGQGSSLSNQNLLTSAGIPQMPDTMPIFDSPTVAAPDVTQNGPDGVLEQTNDVQQAADDDVDSIFDVGM